MISGMADSVTFRSQYYRYLWPVESLGVSTVDQSVASREIAEGEYIVKNTFTYKVSSLL